MSGLVSAAWMMRPMRVRVSSAYNAISMPTETSIMKPRYIGKAVSNSVNSVPSSSSGIL